MTNNFTKRVRGIHPLCTVDQLFIPRDYIYGRSVIYAPYFGMFTIWTTDYPWLRYLLLGMMGLFILTGKE